MNPNGLKRNQLSWLNSATVRTAGISPRPGWVYRQTMSLQGRFQRGQMYEPDNEYPYLIYQIEGRTFRCRVDTDFHEDEITIPGDPNPADVERAFFCQGEQFMVQQPGDLEKLPQFFDGLTMRRSVGPQRSLGVVSVATAAPAPGLPFLVTLTAPFGGVYGEPILINGGSYVATPASNFITIRNDSAGNIGGTIPAGTTVYRGGTLLVTTTAPFVVPIVGGTALVPVAAPWPGASPVPLAVGFTNPSQAPFAWTVTSVGNAAPGANQVYLTNINETTGAAIGVDSLLLSAGELPSGESMDYYMGRMWVSAGREYVAGDIVAGPSGTAQYDYRDSILKMTENLFTVGGGAFIVPSNAGNIRCLRHPANIDTALGEGQLKVFTRKSVYSVNVTPDRASWAALEEPIQRVEQINYGAMGDDAVIPVNGDLYYRSVDGVRTLLQGIRYFGQPGNTPISHEESRAFDADDKALLHMCSGILFENRLLITCLPYQTPYGVAHKGIAPLNFDALSSMDNKLPAVWEGVWEGLNVMQLWKGDFGGRERAFAMVYSSAGQLEIWEMLSSERFDQNLTGEARISWAVETPSYTADKVFVLKELDTLELWIDRLIGTVDFTVYLRADQAPCWTFWHHWQECGARNECELPQPPVPCDYPQQQYQPQYRATMILPKPPTSCISGNAQPGGNRPVNIGFAHQFKIVIQGYCRVRGILAHWRERERSDYDGKTC